MFKRIASNYAMAKLDICRHIILDTSGIKYSAPNSASMQVRYILNNSGDYQKYRQLYQSLKVCGLSIETMSGGGSIQWGDDPGSAVISYLSDADGTSYDEATTIFPGNKSICSIAIQPVEDPLKL